MKAIMDKFKSKIQYNKKLIVFLIVLGIVALVSGSIFTIMLNNNDKELTINYINMFFNSLKSNNLDYLNAFQNGFFNYFSFILIVWLLGMSVIGIPIVLFMFFSKIFVLGFSVSAIITNYGLKGCLISFSYIFPHQIINILVYIILTLSSLKVSGKLLYSIVKKRKLDFKIILHDYLYILLISVIAAILMILYEVYIMPKFVNIFLPLIK